MWWVTILIAHQVWAGGGPLQTLVIVNDNETQSLAIGRYYAAQRGIPDAHILHLNIPDTAIIRLNDYGSQILTPTLAFLAEHDLADQISTFVFTFRRPYRVRTAGQENGITSAFYYGFKNYTSSPDCQLVPAGENTYAGSETAFTPDNAEGYRLSAILTLDTLAEAQTIIDRSLAADYTRPAGTAYALYTSDSFRNVRWPQFDESQFLQRLVKSDIQTEFRFSDFLFSESNVLSCVTGLAQPPFISSNDFVPGAIADHVTSFGGLIDPVANQTSAKEWLRAGCVGTYGTVVEPCNFTNKFPAASTHYYYARGFSMGESYYQGLSHPYQGIVLGDPLCQPFAVPIAVAVVAGLSPVVSGNLTLSLSAASADTNRWVDRMELYVDGMFYQTVTNLLPTAGNVVDANLNGTTRSYTVQPGDQREDVAAGLQVALAAPPGFGMQTEFHSDRIQIKQQALGVSGSSIPYAAGARMGSASRQTVHVAALSNTLLETAARARQKLSVEGTPIFNNALTASIKRLDGQTFTHTVNRVFGDTRLSMVTRLIEAINGDINLQVPGGCAARGLVDVDMEDYTEFQLFAHTNTWESANLEVTFNASGVGFSGSYNGAFRSNAGQMAARGTLLLASGAPVLQADVSLDTSSLADGPHVLSIIAYEGSAVRTQGQTNVAVVVDNHNMTSEIAWPPPFKTFIRHESVSVQIEATTDVGSITSTKLFVEGKAQASVVFDAGNYPAGPLILFAEAQNSAGQTVRSEPVEIILLENEDADGLGDDWEILHFGDITSWAGTNDVDNDTRDNTYEFVTDTDPNDPEDFFTFSILLDPMLPQVEFQFPTSAQRMYQIEYQDDLLSSGWNAMMPLFPGSGAATNIVAPPLVPRRYFRARIGLP